MISCLLVLGSAATVRANGRPPGTSTINFKRGDEQHIAAGMTFGLLISSDGGATWEWMCEQAVGYGGMYDPDYTYTSSGALFGTTFDGLKVMRDGCVFQQSTMGTKFVTTDTQGSSDGALHIGVANPPSTMGNDGDYAIYKSTDDGATFPISAMPGMANDWWSTLEVAPTDPDRSFMSAYRFVPPDNMKVNLLFRSDDGGQTYDPLPVDDFSPVASNSSIEILAIGKKDVMVGATEVAARDLVFARVTFENNNNLGDGVYRSIDGGENWTKILAKQDQISLLVRANGDLVAGTQLVGSFVSHDQGDTWEPLANAPHINCLVENSLGEVWACTQNFGSPQIPSDGAGIMKSTDLATWTPVLRYQNISAPVTCPAGTSQHDDCLQMWCALKAQLGIQSTAIDCAAPTDAGVDAPTSMKPDPGCCGANRGPGPSGILALLVIAGIALMRRHRVRFVR